MPNAVASSVFHGSWPTRPSTTQAPQRTTRPNCFSERYLPDGLGLRARGRCFGDDGALSHRVGGTRAQSKSRATERKRQPKLPFSSGAPSGLARHFRAFPARSVRPSRPAAICRRRLGASTPLRRRAPAPPSRRRLGRVALAELVDAAGGVDHFLLARVERVARRSRLRREAACTTVERVVKMLPQLQVTLISPYFGWMPVFMMSSSSVHAPGLHCPWGCARTGGRLGGRMPECGPGGPKR